MYDSIVTTRDETSGSASSRLGTFFVIVYLIGIYTHVTVFVAPGVPWPAAVASIAGFVLLMKNASSIRRNHVAPVLFLVTVALVSMLFAPDAISLLGERAKSFLLLTYSIVVSYGLYLELVRWRRTEVANVFFVASVLIILGCALENLTAFRIISDSFRHAVFPEQFLYISDVRDQMLFGMIRPKLFTAEPSFLAISFVLSITVWLVLSRSPYRFVWHFLFLGLGLFLIRSPVLLLGALTGSAASFASLSSRPKKVGAMRLNKILLVGLSLLVAVVFLYLGLSTVLSKRLDVVVSGHDDSFNVRVVAPARIAWETIVHYPFFGAGIGGREAISDIVLQTHLPIIVGMDHIYDRLLVGITNVFWLHWIFFGLFGGLLAMMAIIKLMRGLGSGGLVFPSIVMLGFAQTMGAYVGPRYWTVFFVVLAATYLAGQPATTAASPLLGLTHGGWETASS